MFPLGIWVLAPSIRCEHCGTSNNEIQSVGSTVIEWSLNELGLLNDLAAKPQQLLIVLGCVTGRMFCTPGGQYR